MLGLLQGVSELFPVSSLGHSVILPRLVGLAHPPERQVLHHLPRRDAPRDRDRAARLLLARLGADPQGPRPLAARPRHRPGRHGREARLAARRRNDPGRAPRAAAPEQAAQRLRVAAVGGDLPLPERTPALRRGAAAAAGAAGRGRRRHAHRAPGRLARAPPSSARRRRSRSFPASRAPGATMGGGLLVGLSHKDAARFAFLLATPIIGAAAALKLPELAGPTGNGVRGPAARRRRSARRSPPTSRCGS